jgi:hypothetical protein
VKVDVSGSDALLVLTAKADNTAFVVEVSETSAKGTLVQTRSDLLSKLKGSVRLGVQATPTADFVWTDQASYSKVPSANWTAVARFDGGMQAVLASASVDSVGVPGRLYLMNLADDAGKLATHWEDITRNIEDNTDWAAVAVNQGQVAQGGAQAVAAGRVLLAAAADDAWHAAGDRSVDASWYSRRALLMGVSAAAELFMLTDHSPGHADTWAFVERRLEELSSLSARGAEGAAVAAAAGAGAGAVAEGVMAMLRPCLGRDGEGLARLLPQPPSGAPSPAQALQALLQAAEQAARAANLPSPIDVGQALLAQLAPRPKAQRSSGGSGEELR